MASDNGFSYQIPIPEELKKYLETPTCLDIGLPDPKQVDLTLFSGAKLKGINFDPTKIPTDCSLNLSLMLQLGPILANLECIIRVLKLIKPLIDIVKGLPFPPAKAITDFGEAAVDVGKCIVSLTTPLGMIPFVKDILIMIVRTLKCILSAMSSILETLEKLSLDMLAAEGNPTEQALIECAKENAQRSAIGQLQAVEPVMVIIGIAGTIFEIAGVGPIEIPTFEGVEEIEDIRTFVSTMEEFVATLELIVDALP